MHKEYFWIKHLRVVATLSVILLHASAVPVLQFGKIDLNTWWIGNMLDGGVRFCVPIFFMISGALLLSKDYTLYSFLKKRFLRLIPPFIFWSLVYIAYNLARDYHNGEVITLREILRSILGGLYKGSSFHLWFVYSIMGLYLLMPFVRSWIKNATEKEVFYFLSIWGITICFNNPYFGSYKPSIELMYFSGYIGYIILGYFLSHNNNKLLNNKLTGIFLILIGNLITILGTYLMSKNHHSFNSTFYSYLTPNITCSAIGVFLLFKNFKIRSILYLKLVNLISNNSYGIYLVHVLVLDIMGHFGLNWKMSSPFMSIIVITLVCFVVSSLIIMMMKKGKMLRVIAG